MNRNRILFLFPLIFFFLTINLIGCSGGYIDTSDDDLKVLHERTFTINPGNQFTLETSAGDVLVTTWDKPEVYIKVLGNERAGEKIDFDFSGNDKEVKITAKREGSILNWFSRGISLRFEVKVPKQFNSTINTSGGDIRIADVNGKVNIRTSGGDIALKRIEGELRAGTSGGDITIENTNGIMDVSTSGGDITGIDFNGDLEAETSGGDIHLKGSNSKIKAETSGGDIVLIYSGENKGIALSSSGGDITVDVPTDFNANARLSTSGGSVSCNMTINNATNISSSKFEAELNNGGNPLIAKTSGGDIRVRKK